MRIKQKKFRFFWSFSLDSYPKVGYSNNQIRQNEIKTSFRTFLPFFKHYQLFLEENQTMKLTKISLIAVSVGATLASFPAIAGDSTQIQDSTQINTQIGTENTSKQTSRQGSVMDNQRGSLSGTSQSSYQDTFQDGMRNSNVQRNFQRSEHRNIGEYMDGDTAEDSDK